MEEVRLAHNPLSVLVLAPSCLTSFNAFRKKWEGPLQYEDPTGELMMLPTEYGHS